MCERGGGEGEEGEAVQAQELLQIHLPCDQPRVESRGQSLEPPQRGGSNKGPQDTQLKDRPNQAQPVCLKLLILQIK